MDDEVQFLHGGFPRGSVAQDTEFIAGTFNPNFKRIGFFSKNRVQNSCRRTGIPLEEALIFDTA